MDFHVKKKNIWVNWCTCLKVIQLLLMCCCHFRCRLRAMRWSMRPIGDCCPPFFFKINYIWVAAVSLTTKQRLDHFNHNHNLQSRWWPFFLSTLKCPVAYEMYLFPPPRNAANNLKNITFFGTRSSSTRLLAIAQVCIIHNMSLKQKSQDSPCWFVHVAQIWLWMRSQKTLLQSL